MQARKTYVTLVSPRRTFALIQPTTRSRVDLGLSLDGIEPGGRLRSASGVGNDMINVRIGLESARDLDDEAVGWLRWAYEANA